MIVRLILDNKTFYMTKPIHLLALGLILFFIIGWFIGRQNNILKSAGDNTGFTAYNQKKKKPEDLVSIWRNDPYTEAVKNIIYLDFVWMLVFGSSIFYGLEVVSNSNLKLWKSGSNIGMIMIILMVVIDGLQDIAIYKHLTTGSTFDIRGLTRLKFTFISISLIILVLGATMNWKLLTADD